MKTSHHSVKVNYVLDIIKNAGEDHREIIQRLLAENLQNPNSFICLLRDGMNSNEEVLDPTWAYHKILQTVEDYIDFYNSPASSKQLIYSALYNLCDDIGKHQSIPGYEGLLKELPSPVKADITVDLIKSLHNQEGITKAEFAGKHKLKNSRTVQNHIQALSGKRNPLRIGGFVAHVPVKHHEEEAHDKPHRYFTPDTLSPVIFLMNITQVGTLLQSFYYSNQQGNELPVDMAIDTWCQLTDYAKGKIREKFCRNDPGFSKFLDTVEKYAKSVSYRFMTESEMLAKGNASVDEQLLIAEKGGEPCDLILNSPLRTLKNQIINYDDEKQCYYAVSAENPGGDRLEIEESEFDHLLPSW